MVSIVDAVHASMAIPLFFAAVQLDKTYVDGGLFYNYPLDIFDKEGANLTLGLRVDTKDEQLQHRYEFSTAKPVTNFRQYLALLLGSLIDNANRSHLSSKDWERTIYLDSLGVSATDFNLSGKQKQDLYESGIFGAGKYFDWYDHKN